MEIWEAGMPPREEALAAIRELERPSQGEDRRSIIERIPVVAWILVVAVVAIAILAWGLSRS